MGLHGWIAATAISAGGPVLLAAATDPSPETAKWLIGGMATTIVSLAGFAWRQYERRSKAEVELAIAKTRLEGYGKSAPELAEDIRRLGELFEDAMKDDEGFRQAADRLVWPYDRPRRNPRRRP